MKVEIAADLLLSAAESAAALAPGTHIRPILETTLVEVGADGAVTLSATDHATSMVWFRVEGGESPQAGRMCVPSANLLRVVKRAGKAPVTLSWNGKSTRANVAFQGTRASLPVENPVDYPEILRFDDTKPYVTVPASIVMGLLSRVNFATAGDFKSRALAGVRMSINSKTISLTATDGIRMAVAAHDIANESGCAFECVTLPIKPKDVQWIAGKEGNVDLQKVSGTLRMRGINGERLHNAMTVDFPKFDLESQLALSKRAVFKTKDLQDALERAVMLKAKSPRWEFTFNNGHMTVNTVTGLDGNLDADAPVEWTHAQMAIRLSPSLLLEAVKAVKSEIVDLDLESPREPVRLREANGGLLYLYALGAQV